MHVQSDQRRVLATEWTFSGGHAYKITQNHKNAKELNLVKALILFNNNIQAGSILQLYNIYIKISAISI